MNQSADLPGIVVHRTLEAMNAFLRRASQVQRTSRVKAPKAELNGLLLSYKARAGIADRGKLAREMIREFTRVAQGFAESVQATKPHGREWKKLRKPLAQLHRQVSEHDRWEGLRRLKSPKPIQFATFGPGTIVKVLPGSPPLSTYKPFIQHLEESFRGVEEAFLSDAEALGD